MGYTGSQLQTGPSAYHFGPNSDMPNSSTEPKKKTITANRNFIKLVAVSGTCSLLLLGGVAWTADWTLVKSSFATVDFDWLMAAAFFMVIVQFAAGLRLATLLPDPKGNTDCALFGAVKVCFLYQAMIKLLPFRLGEVVFFGLTKKILGAPFDRTLGVFLRFRLWDLRVVTISFLTALQFILSAQYEWLKTYAVIAAILCTILFVLSPQRIFATVNKILLVLTLVPGLKFLRAFSEVLEQATSHMDKEKNKVSEWTLLWQSVLLWGLYYGVLYCLMRGIGMEISIPLAITVASGMTLVGVIPIQTIGGLGLVEIGQSSLYVLAGISVAEAASRSLSVSMLFLGLCVIVPASMWTTFALAQKLKGYATPPSS